MARSEKVSYWRGKHASIPSNSISGRILCEEDTGDVFLEYQDRQTGELIRRQLTDNRKFNIAGGTYTGPVVLLADPDTIAEQSPELDIPKLAATKNYVDKVSTSLVAHTSDLNIHITESERTKWNEKVTSVEYTPILDSGVELGKIKIDDGAVAEYTIYAPEIHNIDGTAAYANKLSTTTNIDGVSYDGSQNVSHIGICTDVGPSDSKSVNIPRFNNKNNSLAYIYFQNDDIDPATQENPIYAQALITSAKPSLGESIADDLPEDIHLMPLDQKVIFMEIDRYAPAPRLWINSENQFIVGVWYNVRDFLLEVDACSDYTFTDTEDYWDGEYIRYTRNAIDLNDGTNRVRYIFEFTFKGYETWETNWALSKYFPPDIETGELYTYYLDIKINDTTYPVYYNNNHIRRGVLTSDTYGFVLRNNRLQLIRAIDTQYDLVNASTPGLMSNLDKIKLDSVEDNANAYVLPAASYTSLGGVVLGNEFDFESEGQLSLDLDRVKSNIGIFRAPETHILGNSGLVPMPYNSSESTFLTSAGTWRQVDTAGTISPIPDDVIDEICQ